VPEKPEQLFGERLQLEKQGNGIFVLRLGRLGNPDSGEVFYPDVRDLSIS
jgi:hypothetical protein